ncbi:MAG: hypothetical protein AAB919_02435 [Patescibacteria group bacterium]
MPNDRSIRNIQVHHRHKQAAAPEPTRPQKRPRRRNRRLWWLALGVVVVAAALGLLLSTIFAGVTVAVTPRTAAVALPPSIVAQQNAPVGTLAYQTLSVTQSATTTVAANGIERVQKQASGVINISNNFSTASQRLIANTRFAAPDGRVYRIRDSVVVPGTSGGKPGTVSITAYADSPGPDYNRSGTTAYTIPGFKGDPRYAKITASSGPITGGFVGDQPSVAPADLQKAKQALEQQLSLSLNAALLSNLPDGYKVIDGTAGVSYGDMLQAAGGSIATLSESATLGASIVRINDLATAVAKQTVTGYGGEALTFADPAGLSVSASTSKQTNSLQLQLGGEATLVWVFDQNALKAALVGKPKSEFEAVIKSLQPAIASAEASIRPFWTSSFPSDPAKISITVTKP